jgi:DNA polymerase III sliding clamp (beta) subunit (PCNA family)
MEQISVKSIVRASKFFANRNAVITIIQCTALLKTELHFTDLEIDVTIPYQSGIEAAIPTKAFIAAIESLPNAKFTHTAADVIISEGGTKIKINSEDTSNFPKSIRDRSPNLKPIGSLSASLLPDLLTALDFISNDDLRPAMTQVCIHKYIVATDAHRLFFVPVPDPLQSIILMPKKAIKLMEVFGGEWKVSKGNMNPSDGEHAPPCLILENESGIVIGIRQVDAEFPKWEVVVPKKFEGKAILNTKTLREAIKNGAKFGHTGTKQGVISINKKANSYSTFDIDEGTEYETPLIATFTTALRIGVNWDFLDGILAKCGLELELDYNEPEKAVILDNKYLLIPLMMGKI